MSAQFQETMYPRLLSAAQQAAIAAGQSAPNNREKKLRDFLGKLHAELIGKNPYIKIVTPYAKTGTFAASAASPDSAREPGGVERPVVSGAEP
jgi:hypothetical protein